MYFNAHNDITHKMLLKKTTTSRLKQCRFDLLDDEDEAVGKVEIFVVLLLVTVVVDEVTEAGVLLDASDELLVVSFELVTVTSNCKIYMHMGKVL